MTSGMEVAAEARERILLVQSGRPAVFARMVDAVRARAPGAALTAVVRGGTELLLDRTAVEVIVVSGASPAVVRGLRARRFDAGYLLACGDAGFAKLKLLPFLAGARRVFAVNENLDWFPVELRNAHVVAQHLRWRLESSLTWAGEPGTSRIAVALKLAAYPAVLAYLLAYERVRVARARHRGAPRWKDGGAA